MIMWCKEIEGQRQETSEDDGSNLQNGWEEHQQEMNMRYEDVMDAEIDAMQRDR